MAVDPITPLHAEDIGIVFPMTPAAQYGEPKDRFPDPQAYTILQIYGMVESALKAAGVPDANVSLPWFLFFFREMINDYSAHIGELQKALRFVGGGSIFKIPHLRDIVVVDVNGYGSTRVAEQTMISYRAAGMTMSSSEWLFSVNGNLLNVYPAVGDDDTITIFATIFAEDFNEDAVNTIIPPADAWVLYHGILFRCLENQQKPFLHEKEEYLQGRTSRAARVQTKLHPTRVAPYPL